MKLVYISNSKLPASFAHGVQIMQMCAAFAENGLDVELMVPQRVGTVAEDPFGYYNIKRAFKITKVPCIDLIYKNNNKLFFYLQFFSFLAVCRLILVFKKYDLLYSRDYIMGFLFKNLILEIHAIPKDAGKFYRYVCGKARALVVLTSFIKNKLITFSIERDKILVAPDAVDLLKFDINISREEARKKLGLPLDKKLIGYVGMLRTMGMEKGIDVAIRSLSEIKDKKKDIRLLLVGGLPDDVEFYKNFAKDLGILDMIIFTGMVKHELVPLYLKSLDVAIAPFPKNEHYNFYMSPLKIFEYMASGRPVISTDLPSLREILNNHNSILVSPNSSTELSQAIIKVFGDDSFSQSITKQALKDVDNYTWMKRAGNILSFARHMNAQSDAEAENVRSFSSGNSVKEYSKMYLRPGEEYVIKKYMADGDRVLDIGCGAGRTTSYIYDNGASVIGADIAEPLVREAKKNFPEINFRVMDVRRLNFQDETFDTVFFSFNGIDNLASLGERKKAILEMKRVLKPGGHLIYTSHNSLAIPRTKTSFQIIFNNLSRLRVGSHWRVEKYDFGRLTQYYNNIWNEVAMLRSLDFKNIRTIGNSKRFLHAPKFVLSFVDKFPIYIAEK